MRYKEIYTPQNFVTDVFHAQEGVIIDDLWPTDDKYKEVINWLRHSIREFCLMEDWSFFREALILGKTDPIRGKENKVPKYELPDWVDRVCMLFDDSLKLHSYKHDYCSRHCENYNINENDFIAIPYASKGFERKREFGEYAKELQARVYDHYIEFNRLPVNNELHRVAVCDVQIKPHMPHICDDKCVADKYKLSNGQESTAVSYDPNNYHPCNKIEKEILADFPQHVRDYFVFKTAYYNSMFSPVAQAIKMDLDNTCKTLLSNLRKLDAAKTSPDYLQQDAIFMPFSVF